jgi:hypothetical protein
LYAPNHRIAGGVSFVVGLKTKTFGSSRKFGGQLVAFALLE